MATIMGSRGAAPAAATAADMPASHPYSCNTCQVAFRNGDLQKGHMKSDWHRYNLKRRVASLPPISSELFAEKVLQSRATTAAEADKASFERVCDVCQKTYYSENSYQNHVSSQKHRAKEAAVARNGVPPAADDEASSVMSSTFSLGEPHTRAHPEVDSDAEEEFAQVVEGIQNANIDDRMSPVRRPSNPHPSAAAQHKEDHPLSRPSSVRDDSSTPTPTPSKASAPEPSLTSCLFCNYNSPTVALNAAHMERFHGMFIPERQYLVDLEGLVGALQQRIREDFECIYCGKLKSDVFAIQTHMRDKSHCKIPYTSLEEQVEIGEFYDFRSTYSDGEDDDDEDEEQPVDKARKQKGGAKLGARRTATVDGEEDEGWETDSSASSLDSADLTAVPADQHYHQYERLDKHPHHSQTDPRAHHQRDGWHSHAHKHNHAVFYDEYELHLPSGKSVGHRSLNRYFRQNLRGYPTPEEREERIRLAIENGEVHADAVEGAEGLGLVEAGSRRSARSRQLQQLQNNNPRTNPGLVGVSDKAKAEIRKTERQAAKAKLLADDKNAIKSSNKVIGQSFRFSGR